MIIDGRRLFFQCPVLNILCYVASSHSILNFYHEGRHDDATYSQWMGRAITMHIYIRTPRQPAVVTDRDTGRDRVRWLSELSSCLALGLLLFNSHEVVHISRNKRRAVWERNKCVAAGHICYGQRFQHQECICIIDRLRILR